MKDSCPPAPSLNRLPSTAQNQPRLRKIHRGVSDQASTSPGAAAGCTAGSPLFIVPPGLELPWGFRCYGGRLRCPHISMGGGHRLGHLPRDLGFCEPTVLAGASHTLQGRAPSPQLLPRKHRGHLQPKAALAQGHPKRGHCLAMPGQNLGRKREENKIHLQKQAGSPRCLWAPLNTSGASPSSPVHSQMPLGSPLGMFIQHTPPTKHIHPRTLQPHETP